MKGKYEVHEYVGIPLTTDNSGHYELKKDEQNEIHPHSWRTGKHTKGKFSHVGQILITENNLKVVIIAELPLTFKQRHNFTPLQRFTSERVDESVLTQGLTYIEQTKK